MFTGAVKIANIDDYISPGQSCIQPNIMKPDNNPTPTATVSLNDCLACSGCLTSSETILLEHMSTTQLMSQINSHTNISFMISPQSLLALSIHYNLPLLQTQSAIVKCLMRSLKATNVYSLSQIMPLCHELSLQEYLKRESKTLLCSECPGWVCYAQKTLNESVVGLMSILKSPQQVMGRCIKEQGEVLVVSIMPCYDKKIEAIRFNYKNGKEVDSTITTTEFIQLLQQLQLEHQFNIPCQSHTFSRLFSKNDRALTIMVDHVSNGYISNLINHLSPDAVTPIPIKNGDFMEYRFKMGESEVKMAKCYGFRNIQRLIQSIKRNKCQYSYVEIMACPGGCTYGGGQPKTLLSKEEMTAKLTDLKGKQQYEKEKQQYEKGQGEYISSISTLLGGQFNTKYKPIARSLQEVVSNW